MRIRRAQGGQSRVCYKFLWANLMKSNAALCSPQWLCSRHRRVAQAGYNAGRRETSRKSSPVTHRHTLIIYTYT